MTEQKIRKDIIKFSKLLNKTNLSPLRSGNISVRYKNGFLITPSGMRYETLKSKDIVFVDLKGKYNSKKNKPSSEWHFHKDIYLNKKNANSVVHCHSKNALVLSCIRKKIPAFHYMVAVAGGVDIKCAKYATYGTSELSKNIIQVLNNRLACLIENHGQVVFSDGIDSAFELAQEVEHLSEQYLECLRIGKPKILTNIEMSRVLKKVKNYKK
ncbi:class II aldolase/adducin family protein [Pelagibacteraceae bacterium]|jgi:L-fuculose-phosphate aldolase|nr:class II aldolase/adducin family protein [Pelagibacteraceae bacterium]